MKEGRKERQTERERERERERESNPQEIANVFNTYFSQIAPELSNKLPRAPRSHLSFLQGNFPHSMSIPLVTVTDIMNTITALKNKKCHVDDIPVKIIKENKELLGVTLSKLFNDSIRDGVFSSQFKVAKIIPIHKSGNKANISNYRPISIFSVFQFFF